MLLALLNCMRVEISFSQTHLWLMTSWMQCHYPTFANITGLGQFDANGRNTFIFAISFMVLLVTPVSHHSNSGNDGLQWETSRRSSVACCIHLAFVCPQIPFGSLHNLAHASIHQRIHSIRRLRTPSNRVHFKLCWATVWKALTLFTYLSQK